MKQRIAVTGVASGIGAALAARLSADGYDVIGFDIKDTNKNVAQFVPLDLADTASINAAVAEVDAPIDGLCNNAGLPPRHGLAATLLKVNFLGTRAFTRLMLRHLKPRAAIVNIASRAGGHWQQNLDQVLRLGSLKASAEVATFVDGEGLDATRAYNLSKEAVIAWTLAQTETLIGRDLRMNSISPGAVATAILDDFARAFGDKVAGNIERAGRAGTAEEIAQLAAFLLSPQSSWIKGIDIAIDGGMGAFNMADMLRLEAMIPSS
ncbi:MAG: coniferyl-alcohol dehydrogenase [Pseudomonadota bacterium]